MQTPFDGAIRRRIHLMRHAEAAYRPDDGSPAPDPDQVPLTARGREQAAAMRDALADLEFDYALCSTLPRTRETATIVLGERPLQLRVEARFVELRGPMGGMADFTPAKLAYSFHEASETSAFLAGGEKFGDFSKRVADGIEHQIATTDFVSALFVCHGGVNRAVLQWVLGSGPEMLATFEQDNACLNVIDIDCDAKTGEIVRRYVRVVNFTPYAPAKRDIHLTTLEKSAVGYLVGD